MSPADLAVVEGLRLRIADTEARLTATETKLDAESKRAHDLANQVQALRGLVDFARDLLTSEGGGTVDEWLADAASVRS